jgi:hypothetical protein
MKLTVKEYAELRGVSEAHVKNKIISLSLEPTPHPTDKRKRQLSLEQQAQLDAVIPKANPSATVVEVVEVEAYQRPTEVGMVLAERAMVVGTIDYHHQAANDNPLYQALQARLESMKSQNALVVQQVQQTTAANRDTDVAIDSLRQMEIIQTAQARAARDHHLEQQAYLLAKQDLQMQAAGLTPVAQPHHPTPPPTSQSSPPSAVGVRSSGSTASPFD